MLREGIKKYSTLHKIPIANPVDKIADNKPKRGKLRFCFSLKSKMYKSRLFAGEQSCTYIPKAVGIKEEIDSIPDIL